jgi:pyruvate/2-oxoglutarate dehydrogenase complex dihydrolipoamide dehydrogenase (E3) component
MQPGGCAAGEKPRACGAGEERRECERALPPQRCSPVSDYDLVVVGAGATGLAAARAARRAGRRVALVDKGRPGGDCTFSGCVPSKTLLDVAHRVSGARTAQQWGVDAVGDVDFTRVMQHVSDVVETVARDESPERLREEGIDLVEGWARFREPGVLDVEGTVLRASRVVLATGATATVPPIEGLADVPYLDNRTLFTLTERPEHLLVLGGGAIGVELAQAFAALGTQVTLVEALPRILSKEEPEASAVLTAALRGAGVDVRVGCGVERVSPGPTLHLAHGTSVTGTHLLVAVGRTPATDGLDLERAGVQLGRHGEVRTDAYLRTTAEGVFAAGDCTSPLQFTHVGDEQGRLAARNAFAKRTALPAALGGMTAFDDRVAPWATFTDPEVGRVGLSEQQAYEKYGERARVAVVGLHELDRPRTAAHSDGYLKLIAGPRRLAGHHALDVVVGLTAVSPSGGELAALGAVAMRSGMLAARLAQTIAPYPTYALGLRIAAARLFGEFAGQTWRPARPDR